jgi:hypothetical protein
MALINKGLSTRLLTRISTVALVACTLGLAAGVASASSAPTTPCDPQYMDALEARAYMEAQREVSQNQNYILKPDSVLEYTCFDKFLEHFSEDTNWGSTCDAYPFSDSCRWGAVFMQPAYSIWGSVDRVVTRALQAYLTGQFSYNTRNYLYGRATNQYPPSDIATEVGAPGAPTDKTYACTEMEAVWMQAHCYNFAQEPDHDAFYQFDWYKTNDPRANAPKTTTGWKGAGGMCTVATPYSSNDAIIEAFNGAANDAKYDMAENLWSSTGMTDTTPYKADPVLTHLDLIMPVGASPSPPAPSACSSVTPIPTGVCVVRAGWNQVYEDAVCPNPGCYYKAPGAAGTGADPASCPSTAVGTCGP